MFYSTDILANIQLTSNEPFVVTLVHKLVAAAAVDSQAQCSCKGLSERPILHNLASLVPSER